MKTINTRMQQEWYASRQLWRKKRDEWHDTNDNYSFSTWEKGRWRKRDEVFCKTNDLENLRRRYNGNTVKAPTGLGVVYTEVRKSAKDDKIRLALNQ